MTSFRRLLAATWASNLGDGILVVSLPLMAASITRDPRLVAGVAVAGQLPWLFFALVSGAFVDRVDRRRAMVVTDLARFALVALLALELAVGSNSLAVLYVVAFALGTGETVFDSAAEAFLPAVVPSEHLERANGRLEVAMWVSNDFAGPILGGALFAVLAWAPAAVDASSFLVAAALVSSIRGDFRPERRPNEPLSGELASGIRWLWSQAVLRGLATMSGAINLLAGGVVAVFVLYAQEELGVQGSGFGILLASLGVGGGVGALAAGRVVGTLGVVQAIRLSLAGFIAASTILAWTSNAVVAGAMIAVYGASITLWRVVVVSVRQRLTPDAMRGRVAGATRLIAWGTRPVGALLGGIVAGAFGLRAPFVSAVGVFAVALIASGRMLSDQRIASTIPGG